MVKTKREVIIDMKVFSIQERKTHKKVKRITFWSSEHVYKIITHIITEIRTESTLVSSPTTLFPEKDPVINNEKVP